MVRPRVEAFAASSAEVLVEQATGRPLWSASAVSVPMHGLALEHLTSRREKVFALEWLSWPATNSRPWGETK